MSAHRDRCHYCGRVVYVADFLRGNATIDYSAPSIASPEPDERVVHTYDCEKAKRRRVAPPTEPREDAT